VEQPAGEVALGWERVEAFARQLADALSAQAPRGGWRRVIAVARGGWIPAVLLASRLGIPRWESAQVSLYRGRRAGARPRLVGTAPAPARSRAAEGATLVVDDVVDSGRTLRWVGRRYPGARLCALVARCPVDTAPAPAGAKERSLGEGLTAWVGEVLPTSGWVLFPWSPAEDR
jgi:xanthine phosphoribosyltransferase